MENIVRGIPKQEISKSDAKILDSMMEHDVLPFHQKSKNDVMTIYDLAQEVYYRHNDKNPELAVRELIEKVKHSKIANYGAGQLMQELKHKIQREHYSVMDKLKYFRILTRDYRIPEGACRSYKLLYDKLKKLENDLVMYIHFENDRFFPLAIEMENYLNEKN